MATRAQIIEREEARTHLRALLKPGDRVYVKLNHVSRSGMYRVLDLYITNADCRLQRITHHAVLAAEYRYDKRHEGLGTSGCGMDMGFDAVYNLSCALFCPDAYDHDAAYALKHEWI